MFSQEVLEQIDSKTYSTFIPSPCHFSIFVDFDRHDFECTLHISLSNMHWGVIDCQCDRLLLAGLMFMNDIVMYTKLAPSYGSIFSTIPYDTLIKGLH